MRSRTMVNLGEQRFDRIREQHAFYIDKTGFIKEWWEYGSTVTLLTRPRRFGKKNPPQGNMNTGSYKVHSR